MAASWRSTDAGLNWETASDSGTLASVEGAIAAVSSQAARGWKLRLESLSTDTPEGRRAFATSLGEPAIGGSVLRLPIAVESPLGLRGELVANADPRGLLIDLVWQTVADVRGLRLDATLELGEPADPADALVRSPPEASGRLAAFAGGPFLAVADLGEEGQATRADESPGRVRLTHFDRPLEKGVILVGRIGLARAGRPLKDAWAKRLEPWFFQPSFL